MPFACGLTLEQLSAHTVDEAGKPAFVKDNPLEMLRKVRPATLLISCSPSVQGCQLYLSCAREASQAHCKHSGLALLLRPTSIVLPVKLQLCT